MRGAIRIVGLVLVLAAGATTYLTLEAYLTLHDDVGMILAAMTACLLCLAALIFRRVGWTDDVDAELARRFRQQARLASIEAERARLDHRRSDVLVCTVQRDTWTAAAEHAEGSRHAS